jgi:hypothetical protein
LHPTPNCRKATDGTFNRKRQQNGSPFPSWIVGD